MNKLLRNFALVALVAAPASAFAETAGSGTLADPYQIATAEDLCGAHSLIDAKMAAGDYVTYFVQTADIDMDGKTEGYIPLLGGMGNYDAAIVYDGHNHVITGWHPTFVEGYYRTSIFGVLNGELRNLGVIDAAVDTSTKEDQAAGILGGYLGQGNTTQHSKYDKVVVENVYVTGSVKAGSKYAGGFFGTTGIGNVQLNNCFFNGSVETTGGASGALIGRISNPTTLNHCYVAGTVNATTNLVAGGSNTLTANGVYAFNTGNSTAFGGTLEGEITVVEGNKDAAIQAIQGWNGFSATELVAGYPALAFAMSGEGTQANPYVIYSEEALCAAWKYTTPDHKTYFIQTADLDMQYVEDYHCFVGYDDATYGSEISYDGQNHVIENFMPQNGNNGDGIHRYDQTLFGVVNGEIKNLGVTGYISGSDEGAGFIGAYAGHATKGGPCSIENVWAQGTIETSYYGGGLFGTTNGATTIKNCFANVEIEGSATDRQIGGLVGRTDAATSFENCYAAGSITSAAPARAGLICGTGSGSVTATNVIAFNTGATAASGVAVTGTIEVVNNNEAELIAKVQDWAGYSKTELIEGYPALDPNAAGAGIADITVDNDAPATYYNLQGVQVANPANGIFIVRRGNTATKVLVK